MLSELEKSAIRKSNGLLYGTHQWSVSNVQRSHLAGVARKQGRSRVLRGLANGALLCGLSALAIYLSVAF